MVVLHLKLYLSLTGCCFDMRTKIVHLSWGYLEKGAVGLNSANIIGALPSFGVIDDDSVLVYNPNVIEGDSSQRQMGDALLPISLGTNRSVLAFAVGEYRTCALLDNSVLKCFGQNVHGQLGDFTTQNRGDDAGKMGDALNAVDLDGTVVNVKCGRGHVCALLEAGLVKWYV